MSASDHLNPHQSQLFDTTQYDKPAPRMDYDPETWIKGPDISYHASDSPRMPQAGEGGGGFGEGFHHGTVGAAMYRGRITSASHISPEHLHSHMARDYVHPVRMVGETAIRDEPFKEMFRSKSGESEETAAKLDKTEAAHAKHPMVFSDTNANMPSGEEMVGLGLNVPYINGVESAGSVSFRSPRQNLKTWAEDVRSDPGASTHHKLLAQQFDLTIPARENFVTERLQAPRSGLVESPSGKTAIDTGHVPNARNLPHSLSGEVIEQPSLFEGEPSKLSGSSKLTVLQPKLKKRPTTWL
jgi:hypothetical protein